MFPGRPLVVEDFNGGRPAMKSPSSHAAKADGWRDPPQSIGSVGVSESNGVTCRQWDWSLRNQGVET